MDISFLEKEQLSTMLADLMVRYDQYYWAVAWGTMNDSAKLLLKNSKKINKIIFGTHFYQTDPKLLKALVDNDFVRVILNDSPGVFHPKVYLFMDKDGNAAAIVGSANFTFSAFTRNVEASVLIEGQCSDDIFMSIKKMIDESWSCAIDIDDDFINAYTLQHNATSKYRKKLKEKRKSNKPKADAVHKGLRIWNWEEYSEEIKGNDFHSYDGRINLLREARKMFSLVDSFSGLSKTERRAISGLLSKGTEHRPGCSLEWGWFGSMVGAGEFQSVINHNTQYMSDALDQIPLIGEISYSQYEQYIQLFEKAFEGKSRKGGVPTASRLLAMKRPDTFFCVDKNNRNALSKDLGFAKSTLDFEKYWYDIVLPITESVWWQVERPTGKDGVLWDNRSAMLDCIYYET